MSTTLAQDRSAFALKSVKDLRGDRDKFAKFVSGMPAMILQNGLGQAMSFMLAKGTKDGRFQPADRHIEAFDMIAEWLKKREILASTEKERVVASLSQMNQSGYLQAQNEALALLEWVKRYANAGLFSDRRP